MRVELSAPTLGRHPRTCCCTRLGHHCPKIKWGVVQGSGEKGSTHWLSVSSPSPLSEVVSHPSSTTLTFVNLLRSGGGKHPGSLSVAAPGPRTGCAMEKNIPP